MQSQKPRHHPGVHKGGKSISETLLVACALVAREAAPLRSGSGRPPSSCQAKNKDGMEGKWPIVYLSQALRENPVKSSSQTCFKTMEVAWRECVCGEEMRTPTESAGESEVALACCVVLRCAFYLSIAVSPCLLTTLSTEE